MNRIVNNKLKRQLHVKLKDTFSVMIDNPVLKARESWSIVSDQLCTILGQEVHTQWFKPVTPLVLKNNILILQTHTTFSAQWINTHYQKLTETLLQGQDSKLNCFFIGPKAKKLQSENK